MKQALFAVLTLAVASSAYADRKQAQQQQQGAKCATVTEKFSGYGNELCINRAQMAVQGFNELNIFVGCPATTMTDLAAQMAKAARIINEACKTAESKSEQTRMWADGWGALAQKFGGFEGVSKMRTLYGSLNWGFNWGCGADGRNDESITKTLDAASTEKGHMCLHILYNATSEANRDPASTNFWDPKTVYTGNKK